MLKPKNANGQKPSIKVIPYKDCLAKSIRLESGNKAGISIETHCRIVGYVARGLLNRLPIWLKEKFFPNGSELIAAAHDVGKISPAFQERIHCDIGKPLGIINPGLDKTIGYHSAVSQAATSACPKYIAEILGRHHGYNSQGVNLPDAEVYGGAGWQKQRIDLLNALKKDLNVDWPAVSSDLHSNVLAGLTTVADWIGSGSLFDKLEQESWKNCISEALDRAGFVTPKIRNGLSFKDVFGVAPYRLQTQLVESIKTQGVYVLEAPMGFGKTEAALYAAYRILEKEGATGIYFALPTQLTSNKIYDRMDQFLLKILCEAESNQRCLLLHSFAWLRDTELGAEGAPGNSWFNSLKRGLLAPFAVGTIDQALMAVMNVKHGFVRTFGLAGKVVILDEVHSYDSYTGTILKELVTALRELCCTVIILSATLTDRQRRSIVGAPFNDSETKKCTTSYPLISVYPREGLLQELDTEKLEESEASICISSSDDDAIAEVIKRAERQEQVLWIENTVIEAQKRYCLLAARVKEIGVDCGLLHSRFIKADRQENENKWVNLFGKAARDSRKEKGRILVGTQVLEQSLDIDADFLVTRLCPTDMLFQRLGRLWRHRENDVIRPVEAKREAWILAPDLNDAILNQEILGKSAKVYSPYILCRTLEAWQDILAVNLPRVIRPLLEATYKERSEKGNMAGYKHETEKKREELRLKALVGVSRGGKTLPESKASTRYSETEATEILLIKNHKTVENGTLLRFLDGSDLLLPRYADAVRRRQIASQLFKNTVMVPDYLAPATSRQQIKWLRGYVYLGDDEECPFRVAIVADNDELQGIGYSDVSGEYNLSYNSCLGYMAQKKRRSENNGE